MCGPIKKSACVNQGVEKKYPYQKSELIRKADRNAGDIFPKGNNTRRQETGGTIWDCGIFTVGIKEQIYFGNVDEDDAYGLRV